MMDGTGVFTYGHGGGRDTSYFCLFGVRESTKRMFCVFVFPSPFPFFQFFLEKGAGEVESIY